MFIHLQYIDVNTLPRSWDVKIKVIFRPNLSLIHPKHKLRQKDRKIESSKERKLKRQKTKKIESKKRQKVKKIESKKDRK